MACYTRHCAGDVIYLSAGGVDEAHETSGDRNKYDALVGITPREGYKAAG